MKKKFSKEYIELIYTHPEILWSNKPAERAKIYSEWKTEQKMKKKQLILELTGTEIKNLNNVLFSYQIHELKSRIEYLNEIGLDPSYLTESRLIYLKYKLEWLEKFASWLFPDVDKPIPHMIEVFKRMIEVSKRKTYADKLILEYNKVQDKLERLKKDILEKLKKELGDEELREFRLEKQVDEKVREFILEYPGYLVSRIKDHHEYLRKIAKNRIIG